jgi:hypothetical protein
VSTGAIVEHLSQMFMGGAGGGAVKLKKTSDGKFEAEEAYRYFAQIEVIYFESISITRGSISKLNAMTLLYFKGSRLR